MIDLVKECRIRLEDLLGGIAALRQLGTLVAELGASLLQHTLFQSKIEQRTRVREALVVHDVEFCFGKGRRHFVLNNL